MARTTWTQTRSVGSLRDGADDGGAEKLARFRVLFDDNFAYVWASLARLGVADRDCEDVANEVFLSVYRKLDQYDRARPLRPWLFAFAAGTASDYRRLARHRVDLSGDRMEGEDLLLARERHALVDAALAEVDQEKRVVLILHELDECPIPDAAIALGIPEGTAYSRLRAGRAQFEAAVRRIQKKKERP
jgi:RNA polymerase sigma-70 factor (ECF subfamily)